MIPNFFPVTFTNQRLDWMLYSWELALTSIIQKVLSRQRDSFPKRSTTAISSDSNTAQLLQVILRFRKGLKSRTQEIRKGYLTQNDRSCTDSVTVRSTAEPKASLCPDNSHRQWSLRRIPLQRTAPCELRDKHRLLDPFHLTAAYSPKKDMTIQPSYVNQAG